MRVNPERGIYGPFLVRSSRMPGGPALRNHAGRPDVITATAMTASRPGQATAAVALRNSRVPWRFR